MFFMFLLYFASICANLSPFVQSAPRTQTELHIGGVFPMEAGTGGWPGGQVILNKTTYVSVTLSLNR